MFRYIRRVVRAEYPKNWERISKLVRFELYGGRCMFCGAEPEPRGLACMHLDRDSSNNELTNLGAGCFRCHALYDRADNLNKRKYGRKYRINQLTIKFWDYDIDERR